MNKIKKTTKSQRIKVLILLFSIFLGIIPHFLIINSTAIKENEEISFELFQQDNDKFELNKPFDLSNLMDMRELLDKSTILDYSGNQAWLDGIQGLDQNNNGISDSLEQKLDLSLTSYQDEEIRESQPLNDFINGESYNGVENPVFISHNEVPIIIQFPDCDIGEYCQLFEEKTGTISAKFDEILNGFAGKIDYTPLIEFCEALKSEGVAFLVEEDAIIEGDLYSTSRNMNLRPYTWNNLSYTGDKYGSIAVLDSGIDDSHNFFEPGYSNMSYEYKIVGWKDFINDIDEPYDDNGHGTHCAGIAAGEGEPDLDSEGRLVDTFGLSLSNGWSFPGIYESIARSFEVNTEGDIEIQCKINGSAVNPDEFHVKAYLMHGETIMDSHETPIDYWEGSLTCQVTPSNFGNYSIKLVLEFIEGNGDIYVDGCDYAYKFEIHRPFEQPPLYNCGDPWKGIAPDTNLVGVKVLNEYGSGSSSRIINGIDWVIANKETYNITTISMSLGGGPTIAMTDAVNNAVERGVVVVVSGGNSGGWLDTNAMGSPALAENVITVAAMNDKDHVTSYSSAGGESFWRTTVKPDVMAPGGSVIGNRMYSADTNDNDLEGHYPDGFSNDLYQAAGTSMAAPAVAGATNLLIEAMGGYENWNYTALEAKRVKALLLMTATETYPLFRENYPNNSPLLNRGGKDIHEGYGRINIDAGIEAWTQELLPESSKSSIISSSVINPSEKHALGCHVNLLESETYKFSLSVPTGADFDLYLYSATPTSVGDPMLVASSISQDLGMSEVINYSPSESGKFFLVAKAISGDGIASVFYQPNNFEPTLTNGNVSPSTSTQVDLLNFSVIYSDPDDIRPNYVQMEANGAIYQMEKVDSNDENYADGCVYQYTGYFQPGDYNITFKCKDGSFINSYVYDLGYVVNVKENEHLPFLINGQADPGLGYINTTIFTFAIDYFDLDNNEPESINVIINSTLYTMTKRDPYDDNYMDGCIYEYITNLDKLGEITYNFACFDGSYSNSTGMVIGPTVIEGGKYPFDGMYMNYIYKPRDLLDPILYNYTYSFISGDIFKRTDSWRENGILWSGYLNESISNRIMSSSVVDEYGLTNKVHTPNWIFTNVTIGDKIPIFVDAYEGDHDFEVVNETLYEIPGVGEVEAWVLKDTEKTDQENIALYEKKTGIRLSANIFPYFWYDYYTYELLETNAPILLIPNNFPPILSDIQYTPGSGDQTTEYIFTALYTDGDNNEPEYLKLIVDGLEYLMKKQNSSDSNYSDGCLYEYRLYFQPGTHIYSVEWSDGKFDCTISGFSEISVSEKTNDNEPFITNVDATPEIGHVDSTTFTFTVDYFDLDNNAPEYLNITLFPDSYVMIKQDSLDNNYMDGCTYSFSTTLDKIKTYGYDIDFSDGDHAFSIGAYLVTVKDMFPFDGMYVNYSFIQNAQDMGSMVSQLAINYSVDSKGVCTALADYNMVLSEWVVDRQTRVMNASESRIVLFYPYNRLTPIWIFNNASVGDEVKMAVGMDRDHSFAVIDEIICDYPGIGVIEIFVLEDLSLPGGVAWYEKSTGLLLNGTFYWAGYIAGYYLGLSETNVEMNKIVIPDFTADKTTIELGETIQFIYNGIGGNNPSYFWDFGDGSIASDEQNPTHVYSSPGIYNVTLYVSDDIQGEWYILQKVDFITVTGDDFLPNADFLVNATMIMEGEQVQFIFNGSEGNNPARYYWEFGDGYNSTEQNPIHQYSTSGTYNVSLTIIDIDNDVDAITKVNLIIVDQDLKPNASFTSDLEAIRIGESINFTFEGSEGDGPASFFWNFDDGYNSTEKNPIHQFLAPGIYNVTLTITDSDGDIDKHYLIIIVLTEESIPGYDMLFVLGIISIATIILFKRRRKALNYL